MKKCAMGLAAAAFCLTAQAEVGVFAGITYMFSDKGEVGLTVKALTSNKEDKAIGALGLSYYPNAKGQQWGVDIGAGYQGSTLGALVGYDLLNKSPTISGGVSNAKEDDDAIAARNRGGGR